MNGEDGDENWLTGWEQQCAESIESEPDYDQRLAEENENFQRRIWTDFQDSATAIAQLYRGLLRYCINIAVSFKAFFLQLLLADILLTFRLY